MCCRKWDWLTTTHIMSGTTALTCLNPIAVDRPYFQSSSLGMKGRKELCAHVLVSEKCECMSIILPSTVALRTVRLYYFYFSTAVLLLCYH